MCKSAMLPLSIAVWEESQGWLPAHPRRGQSRDGLWKCHMLTFQHARQSVNGWSISRFVSQATLVHPRRMTG
jgi:hypothetical protein